jgi:hypothetical protein
MANFISICNFPRFESLRNTKITAPGCNAPEHKAILTKLFLLAPRRDTRFQSQ